MGCSGSKVAPPEKVLSARSGRADLGSVQEMKAAGCSCDEAKAAGYSIAEARLVGYSLPEMRIAGYSCQEAMAAGEGALHQGYT